MNPERIAKLKAEVNSLFDLVIRAYGQFLFLQPMMVNSRLHKRMESENKQTGFIQLRTWLYWSFIQELVKVCDDPDKRTPSIRKFREELDSANILRVLKERYSRRTWPRVKGQDFEIAKYLQKQEEAELRLAFDDVHDRFRASSAELIASDVLAGYKKIRNKLIAHNELRKAPTGYTFFDIKDLNLKYGQERKLLEMARHIVDDLDLLVRNATFAWDTFLEQETKAVCAFWEIAALE